MKKILFITFCILLLITGNQVMKYSGFASLLHGSVANDCQDCANVFLGLGINTDITDENGNTPLNLAAGLGKREMVALLIKNGADPNIKNTVDGYAPIHWEASDSEDRIDNLRLLLDHGADPDIKNNDGITPLQMASYLGNFNSAKLLIEKLALIDEEDVRGRTALFFAVTENKKNIIKLLLENGANPDTKDIVKDMSPIQKAIANGNLDIITLFLDNIEINKKNEFGQTILHWAAINSNTDVLSLLIEKGADIEAKDNYNMTPIFFSVLGGRIANTKLLIKKGADKNVKAINGLTVFEYLITRPDELSYKVQSETFAKMIRLFTDSQKLDNFPSVDNFEDFQKFFMKKALKKSLGIDE